MDRNRFFLKQENTLQKKYIKWDLSEWGCGNTHVSCFGLCCCCCCCCCCCGCAFLYIGKSNNPSCLQKKHEHLKSLELDSITIFASIHPQRPNILCFCLPCFIEKTTKNTTKSKMGVRIREIRRFEVHSSDRDQKRCVFLRKRHSQ